MAARPQPAHPGLNRGNLYTQTNSGRPTPEQQDPGLHGTSQDPGPSSLPQHHFSARPVFHAPPPPPFVHYQWPMPFSYNPFAGFPGMGYGMVMPPFAPPPYMEAPAYIMPHPHIQPVDYRRLLHPQVHAPSAAYQNPNQIRRVRPPHTGHVRETVNSAVQTEPTQRGGDGSTEGSPLVSSDSGRGTASNSPSSSTSSSQKRGSAEVENYPLPSSNAEDIQVKRISTSSTDKPCFNVLRPTATSAVQSCIRATLETQKSRKDSVGQENVPRRRSSDFHLWSVSSPDGMVPVCSSSQQEEEVVKERRVSVPDILMSWGGGTPQATMPKMADKQLQNDQQQSCEMSTLDVERDKSDNQSPTETKNGPVVADGPYANDDAEGNLSSKDSATLFKILKLREAYEEQKAESRRENEPVRKVGSVRQCLAYRDELLHSLNKSYNLPDSEQEDGNETNPYEDTTESIPYQMSLNSFQMKRKMNESVWSVESLAPFIPTKEWLLKNSMSDPKVTDSVPVSDSWIIFSTPAGKQSPPKQPETENEIDTFETRSPKQGPNMALSERNPLTSPTHLLSKLNLSTLTEEDVDKNRSSEPEANQSPNQESLIVNEQQQEKSPCSPEHEETLLLICAAGEKVSSTGQLILQNRVEVEDRACPNEEASQVRNEQLCVPMADQKMPEVSPSKGHLVDCGIQCTELQEPKCVLCDEIKSCVGPSRRHPFKHSDMKKANNGNAEGACMKGNMQKNQRRYWKNNRGQEKNNSQQEGYNGYCGKPGKSQGGNGRNPRY